jgi:hypothetical protein
MKTKVIFKIEKEGNTVFAFFPDMLYNVELYGKDMKTCYAYLGQHSACLQGYADECKEANYNEYADLLKELIGQGYKNLEVLNSQQIEMHRKPTKGEIKFGEGATHYRCFPIGDVLDKKGNIKQWIKAKDDSLRYYY